MSGLVAIPIQFASVRISVDKGRHWSVVEHLLLHAVCSEPRPAAKLAEVSDLPLRLVIEAMINLMRVGWVELQVVEGEFAFTATAGGRKVVERDALPPITNPLSRNTKFAIEQLTGSVMRWREIVFLPHNSARLKAPGLVKLAPRAGLSPVSPVDIVRSLLDEDESYRGAQAGTARPGVGFALVTRVGSKLTGLPRDASPALKTIVENASNDKAPAAPTTAPDVGKAGDDFLHAARATSFLADDLVLGGPAHRTLRDMMIDRARSLLVVQSTFVGRESVDDLLPRLVQSVKRYGVTVHLLHGHSDLGFGQSPTREALDYMRSKIKATGHEGFIHLHPFSTRSHGKILIGDDGKGGLDAVVGSCNWLSSRFDAFEVSAKSGDPALVADIIGTCSRMAYEATGNQSGIVMDLAGYANNLRARPPLRGRSTVRLVCGAEHARLIDEARDKAAERIILASHRFGASAETLALIPMRAAVAARDVDASVYFELVSAPLDERRAQGLMDKPTGGTGAISFIRRKAMHAKLLAWDDDDIVVTSHNLLSADPTSPWGEIGLHIHSSGIAARLADHLKDLA